MLKYAKEKSEAYPDLFVTGHSLGGALSVLCALMTHTYAHPNANFPHQPSKT